MTINLLLNDFYQYYITCNLKKSYMASFPDNCADVSAPVMPIMRKNVAIGLYSDNIAI